MKTLLLLRHAKAQDAASGQADLDRLLQDHGRVQAQAMGQFVRDRALNVELVLCSQAARARETAELILTAAGLSPDIRYEPVIYEAGSLQLFDLILNLDSGANSVLLVGHNPSLEDLLHLLTDRTGGMATCTLAKIEIDVDDWSDAAEVSGKLEWIVRAQDLLPG